MKESQTNKQPEFECKDGTLHIVSPLLTVRIRFAPEPLAESLDTRGRWREAWPDFRLLAPETDLPADAPAVIRIKHEAFRAFRASVPAPLTALIEPFQSHQWTLLLFLQPSKSAFELALSNPVLAYAMANSGEIRGKTPQIGLAQAVMQRKRKQKDICDWLGYPGDLAMVRVFRKLRPEAVTPPLLRMLRNAMHRDSDRTRKLLGHCREVNAAMLTFIVYRELADLATPALLDELAGTAAGCGHSPLADSLLHAQRMREEMGEEVRTRPFDSTRQIERYVAETDREWLEHRRRLEAAAQAREAAQAEERQRGQGARAAVNARNPGSSKELPPRKWHWPAPPVPGTADIVPITSYKMLCEESKQQRNCIRTYRQSIAGRNPHMYAYRLFEPERATFVLVRHDSDWRLSEIAGYQNLKVLAKTRHAVLNWLDAHSLACDSWQSSTSNP